jgi:hypothetical protein
MFGKENVINSCKFLLDKSIYDLCVCEVVYVILPWTDKFVAEDEGVVMTDTSSYDYISAGS